MTKRIDIRKIAAFFVCLITVSTSLSLISLAKKEQPSVPDTSGASHIYLYNYESDSIIYSKGAHDKRISPASTVKLMSGYLALQYLGDRLDENIEITGEMLGNAEGFTVGIKSGDILSIGDIVYALICGGGNDAANVVAYLCRGSVESFVSEMNATAHNLGMTNTNYTNPTGLDDTKAYTTVYDTAIISKVNAQNELFIKISTTGKYTYTPKNSEESRNIYNRNALHSTFSASGYKSSTLRGLNAGSTEKGGYCVVAYTSDGIDSYICIVMGGQQYSNDNIASYRIINELTEYYCNNFTYTKILNKGDIISTYAVDLALPTNGYDSVYSNCCMGEDIYAYAPKDIDYKKDLTYKTYFHFDRLIAPVLQGTVVGGVDIYYDENHLATGKLVSNADISESQLLVFLDGMKKIIASRTTIFFVIFLIIGVFSLLRFTIWKKDKIKK